jgi:hypothetical protein
VPGRAATTSRFTDAVLDRLSFVGDPMADEVVAEHVAHQQLHDPRRLVGDIAAHLVLPPERRSPPIERYFAEEPPLPSWADAALMAQGASFFDLYGLAIGSALFCASLPEAYAAARGARTLALTAQMVTDPVRRVNETAQMVFNTVAKGGLDRPAGPGYQDIRRVRLMHAAVRYLILNDPTVAKTTSDTPGRSWDTTLGIPVNQEDLLGTLLTFTTVPFRVLQRQGLGYDDSGAAAYLHTWCVAGALLGIDPDLLPLSLDEAWELEALIKRRQHRPSADAVMLGTSLRDALARSMPPLFRSLPASLITWYAGAHVAEIDGITHEGWTRLLVRPLRHEFERLGADERRGRLVRAITERATVRILAGFMRAARGGDRPPFTLPRELDQRVHDAPTRWRFL